MEYREEHFEKQTYSGDRRGDDYAQCTFAHCVFTDLRLSDVVFDSCLFLGCTFRNADIGGVRMQNAAFRDSALVGIDWSEVRRAGRLFPLIREFTGCTLKYNTFAKMKLPGTPFVDTAILDCAFLECDLSGSVFRNTDLRDTTFQDCTLAKADFREARNYRISTDSNRVTRAKFSLPEVVGLLASLDIVIDFH